MPMLHAVLIPKNDSGDEDTRPKGTLIQGITKDKRRQSDTGGMTKKLAPKPKPAHVTNTHGTECAICHISHDFEIPQHLMEALLHDRVVIFAGAGISTKTRPGFPYTFYDDIKAELKIDVKVNMSFSALMQKYCEAPDGRSRLIKDIRQRLYYIKSFPELYWHATRFHKALSTMYHIQTIVTTNWDDFFEQECAAIPFVTAQDYALWNADGRKVFKIHGSINNYGSIVATAQDYKRCLSDLQKGLLGATLKHLLGTKTIVYVGYSFGDEDLLRIHNFLRHEMGETLPHGYIITLDSHRDAHFGKLGLTPIKTDATHFLEIIKQHLVADGQMISDERFEAIPVTLMLTEKLHESLWENIDPIRYPTMIYCASYQDGLIHCFERMVAMIKTGEYSHACRIYDLVEHYRNSMKRKVKAKKYFDVAYIEGYMNGLSYLLLDNEGRKLLPFYYVYGEDTQPRDERHLKRMLRAGMKKRRGAYKHALGIIKRNHVRKGLAFHHTPFLL